MKAATGRDPAPAPKKSGRRGDRTARRFTRAANRLTRLRGYATAVLWLADTLDWLNLWHPGGTEFTDDLSQDASNNHLSQRL
jgi:hypothetical protein